MSEDDKIQSLDQYLKFVKRTSNEWRKGKQPNSIADPWYRGQLNACPKRTLIPSYLRIDPAIRANVSENALREEFQRRALPMLKEWIPSRDDRWAWYFLMQHYEIQTRLLDWSESSLVALYFAVSDYKGCGKNDEMDGAVWMLDPSYLNEISINTDLVLPFEHEQAKRYLLPNYSSSALLPIAILPIHNSRRIQAQRGMFTIHGTDERPLEAILGGNRKATRLLKIIIDSKFKKSIKEELRTAGISHSIVFPELPFLSLEIRDAWGV